jgi:hypothetical protein
MTDPRDITGDQAEFLDVLEQLALLPQPIVEDDFLPLSERALDLMEARGLVLRGEEKPTIETLSNYRRRVLLDGHELASAGVALLIVRWFAEMEVKASVAPLN